jgi:Tol biopolymer transport system component
MKTAAIALAVTMLTVEQRDGHRSNLDPPSAAISVNGRFVAFTTHARLVPADTDHSKDVYVLDRDRRHVTLESADTGAPRSDSSHPAISGDGRYVAFEHAADVLVRDRQQGVTTLVAGGRQPYITEDGRIVLFSADTFDAAGDGDVNGEISDIYALHLMNGEVRRISVGMSGLDPLAAASVNPSASRDGRYVAFSSRLRTGKPLSGGSYVYVRDTELNAVAFVGSGWDPSLSGDGRFVAFVRLSNRVPHVFVADLQSGTTRIITNSARRGPANGASAKPTISADGRFVAFQSEASDLVAAEDINLLWDVFVFDRVTAAMTRVSGDPAVWMEPSGGPSIDGRGSVVTFSSRHPIDASDKSNDFDLYVATVGGTAHQKYGDGPFGTVATHASVSFDSRASRFVTGF